LNKLSKVSIIAVIIGTLSFTGSVFAKVSFSDTGSHWASQSIDSAVTAGYVQGYEDGTFQPENNVTRAEFVTMLVRALKIPVAESGANVEWYDGFVSSATDVGFLQDGDFKSQEMNEPITRVEMSHVIARALRTDLQAPSAQLSDKLAMQAVTGAGVVNGVASGDLGLNGVTTRAQSVTVIDRIIKVLGGTVLDADQDAVTTANNM